MSEVPENIRVACRHWGSQKRRVWQGGDWYMMQATAKEPAGRRKHVDGYAESLLGRIRAEQILFRRSKRVPHETRVRHLRQQMDDVYFGDGLEVQLALIGMPEHAFSVLHLHYVWDAQFNLNATEKAALIDMKTRAYWEALGRAEYWVWARLECGMRAHEISGAVSDLVEKIVERTLTATKRAAKKEQDGHGSPRKELDLAALNRPTVSLSR